MNANFKTILGDKIVLGSILAGVFLCVLHLLFLLFSFSRMPAVVPLFNQMPWGEERLATKMQLFIPLAIATSILIANFICTTLLYQRMPLVARFLSLTGFLTAFFAFIVVIRTVLIIL